MRIGTAIEQLRGKLLEDINGSGLPPVIAELVVQPIMAELHELAKEQIKREKEAEADGGNAGKK